MLDECLIEPLNFPYKFYYVIDVLILTVWQLANESLE